jgi:hypothetical protein
MLVIIRENFIRLNKILEVHMVKAEAARNILVAWVGASDVSEVNEGPIVTALREKHYQHVHLLVSKDFEQRVADLKRGIEEKNGR